MIKNYEELGCITSENVFFFKFFLTFFLIFSVLQLFEAAEELLAHIGEHGFFLPLQAKPYKCDFCYKVRNRFTFALTA